MTMGNIGVGTLKIKMFDEAIRTLIDVRYIQELKSNFISLSMLEIKCYRYTHEGGVLKVNQSAIIVMKGQKSLHICKFWRVPQL